MDSQDAGSRKPPVNGKVTLQAILPSDIIFLFTVHWLFNSRVQVSVKWPTGCAKT